MKDVCMYIEEFILVDIWIHCCTKLELELNSIGQGITRFFTTIRSGKKK